MNQTISTDKPKNQNNQRHHLHSGARNNSKLSSPNGYSDWIWIQPLF